ncbi:MAG TPA: hypothetical protein VN112_05815 [Ensifer sp.]|nr:hypothetical protein [Ensifer sp.]
MLKVALYIFAVLGLLISPVYAQAAQKDCAGMAGSMMVSKVSHAMASDMKMADGMACCDDDKTTPSPEDKACFNNCIAMCGVSVGSATDGSVMLPVLAVEQISFNDKSTPLFTQEPSLVVPPPKSQA